MPRFPGGAKSGGVPKLRLAFNSSGKRAPLSRQWDNQSSISDVAMRARNSARQNTISTIMQEKKLRLTQDRTYRQSQGPAVVLDQDGTGYLCDYCGTLLLIATDGQITNAVVMCKMCGR